MSRLDIDRLLSELGAESPSAPKEPAPTAAPVSAPRAAGATAPDETLPLPGPRRTDRPSDLTESLPRNPKPMPLERRDRSGDDLPTISDELSVTDIYQPEAEPEREAPGSLTSILQARELASAKQVLAAETIARQSPGTSLLDLLLDQGVDEQGLFEAAALSMGLAVERLRVESGSEPPYDDRLLNRLTTDYCRHNQVLPLRVEAGRVVLGTSRPDDVFVVDDVRRRLGARAMKVVVVPRSDIRAVLETLGAGAAADDVDVEQILGDIEEDDVRIEKAPTDEVDLEREAAESPVIRYVNYIIQTASKEGASDIHIEPAERALKVRFRVDGELFEMMHPPGRMGAAIISRLKIMANLDISERRLPQDGRIRCTVHGRKLDLRMSTIPSTYGEKVVLRILDTRSINVELDGLGFDDNTLTIWRKQIEQPHGIVLVTGPTGSGKTTTLYASLRQMDKKSQNISTVEDPVEYHLDGITQTQTHEKIGMNFARALKALLRQDPDVILVGEIRDQETAHTAVQAALTGHLVLSTLHTNDAPSSITRLVNIGIEPFLLGAAINAALAQRLVRRVCSHCKREARLTDELKEYLALQGVETSSLVEGEGCDRCRKSGYQGRLGLYELLVVDDHLRDVIARNPNVAEFRRLCCERGMVTLRQDGFVKAAKGMTTVHEIIRATEAAA